jgi:hypothetical protein
VFRPHGYAVWTGPEGPVVERDTVTCGHCGCVIVVKPYTASTVYLMWSAEQQRWNETPGAGCRVCMAAVCLTCHDDGRCLPLERRIEAMEQR